MEHLEMEPHTEAPFDYSQDFNPHNLDNFKQWSNAKPEGMEESLWVLKLIEAQKRIERTDLTPEKKEEIIRAWKVENGLI